MSWERRALLRLSRSFFAHERPAGTESCFAASIGHVVLVPFPHGLITMERLRCSCCAIRMKYAHAKNRAKENRANAPNTSFRGPAGLLKVVSIPLNGSSYLVIAKRCRYCDITHAVHVEPLS